MNSKTVGELKPVDYDPDLFESAPIAIPYFENIKLEIGFVEAKHQAYLDSADKVLQKFLHLNSADKVKDSEIIHKYYLDALNNGYTKPLNVNTTKDIWNFVTPKQIIINSDEKGDFYLCVFCGCEWEEEHGLQLVFKDGQTLIRASGHDGHYTD